MIPEFLEKLLEEQYGPDLTKTILNGYKEKRRVTIRVNTIKTNEEHIKEELYNAGIEFETVAWNKEALIISNAEKKDIEEQSIYKKGEVYENSPTLRGSSIYIPLPVAGFFTHETCLSTMQRAGFFTQGIKRILAMYIPFFPSL